MAWPITRGETGLLLALVGAGVALAFPASSAEAAAFYVALIVLVLVAALVVAARVALRKRRIGALLAKHGDPQVVDRIMKASIWVGQTTEQLTDAIGRPVDVDEKVLKTKTKEVWKYAPKGRNRYGLRVTVENGVVVGWDERL